MKVEVTVLPAGAGRENQTYRTYVASCRDGAPTAAGFPTTTSQIAGADRSRSRPAQRQDCTPGEDIDTLHRILPAFTE